MLTTISIRKKLIPALLAAVLLFLSFGSPSGAAAETTAAAQYNDGVRNLFNDDRTFRGNNASQDAYFEIGQGLVSAAGSYIDLFISHSPTLLPELSSLTVLVDDVPAGSMKLTADNASRTEWRVGLPDANLGAGYHKITLAAKLRSNSLICEDPENPSSWMVVMSASRIKLKLVPSGETTDLGAYPAPFIERGEANPVKAVLIVPDAATQAEFAAAARLSQYLAAQTPDGRLSVPIFTESHASAERLAKNNAIWIGGASRWTAAGAKAHEAGIKAAGDGGQEDFIALTPSSWNPARSQLVVSGTGDSLFRAASILTDPSLYRQLQGRSMPIPPSLPASHREEPEAGKAYEVSLADLGYGNLTVQNAARGSANLVYPLPGGWDLPNGAVLRLRFTHSKAIAFYRSKATVRLNGTPVASVNLTEETADAGFLEVPLKPSVIGASRSLSIEIAFQFEERSDNTDGTTASAAVACGPDDALGSWARIAPSSTIEYTPAARKSAYLQSLPFPYVADGVWQPTTFVMERADTASLQLAMTLIGAVGAGNPDTNSLDWLAVNTPGLRDRLKDREVVYIGSTAAMPGELRDYSGSYVKFDEASVAATSDDVQLLPTLRADGAYMQLTASPFGGDNRQLLVLTATSTERLSLLSRALRGDADGDELSGRFVAIDGRGKVYAFPATQDAAPAYKDIPSGRTRWSDTGVSALGFGLAFLAVLALAFLALWYNRRKQD